MMVQLLDVEEELTLVLDDALAKSFIASATDDYEADCQLTSEFLSLNGVLSKCLEADSGAFLFAAED